jgi:DNA-binding LytR/AlgR family response regulator
MLLALRVIFALFTLVPVIVYFYVDMRVIFIRAQRRIIAEKNQSNVPSNLCFSLSLKFQEYLDLSAEFRQMLEKNGIMLSNTVSFITVKIGSQWRIIDNDKIYFFKREKDRINVYVDGDDHE